MMERQLRRYAAYFRGWCQAFGEHEHIFEDANGVNWVTAANHLGLGLVLPKPMIKPLYREVLLHRTAPPLLFRGKSIEIGSLVLNIHERHRKSVSGALEEILGQGNEAHVFLTSHLMYGSGSRIITISSKKPLSIIYKEIGSMRIVLE